LASGRRSGTTPIQAVVVAGIAAYKDVESPDFLVNIITIHVQIN
jgi:hypothetical protein